MNQSYKYQHEIQSMMYTFGEVRYSNPQTTQLVEDMIHLQANEWIVAAGEISRIRGSRSITPEDLLFLVRHDKVKLIRLKEFLSWKEIRKNVKAEPNETFDQPNEDDSTTIDKDPVKKKSPSFCSWEFPICLLDVCQHELNDEEIELVEDRQEYHQEVLERLEEADRLTRTMNREQYIEFAECRQASFTYKKSKKFRDWIGFEERARASDDVLEILGFLLWEGLRTLTTESLAVKREEEEEEKAMPISWSTGSDAQSITRASKKGPFQSTAEASALLPKHIAEAFKQLQKSKTPFIMHGFGQTAFRRTNRFLL